VKSLLNLLFPPRCRLCSERTDYLFCTVCCELMALPDPTLRCGHCFVALESDVRLCMRCTHQPILSAPRAFLFEESPLIAQLLSLLQRQDEAVFQSIIAMLLLFWSRLAWPAPHFVISIPSAGQTTSVQSLAFEFSRILSCPLSNELQLHWTAPFQWRMIRTMHHSLINKDVLLFDLGHDVSWLRRALHQMHEAQPRSIHILSVFECSHIR
jgi:predicted amidophosphoribosyltransferase